MAIKIRAKAFTGGKIDVQKCAVDNDGTVRVWDSVAGHYTTCHVMSKSAQSRVRRLAKEAREFDPEFSGVARTF